ncbi:MAG: oxygen-independent coproporphyrinogen III oxidase [Gracilibacteraceae bacterium]|nr:oxygen-independent coproporphyrinogen III oxidase [Gracilibacteraceae bacterium]
MGEKMKEVGLYIHIPFCRSKCLYCDFNSFPYREDDAAAYTEALLRELYAYQERYGFMYKTVFIGGGTPTVINYMLVGKIIEKLAPRVKAGAEISIESNPGTVTLDTLKYYRSLGINRLSIGLQAWQEGLLRELGRIHTQEDFLNAYYWARKSGFNNISIDLIFALPNQTSDMWKETLDKVISLGVDHISCYSLMLEEGTRLYELYKEGKVQLPDEELDREMYGMAVDILDYSGYSQYEISNFARRGMECKHNLIYWRNEEYIGIGAGSHSKLEGVRFWNYKDINRYIDLVTEGKLPVEGQEELSSGEDMWETIFLALRLNEGLDLAGFAGKYGVDFEAKYGSRIKKLEDQGLVFIESGRLKLTDKGRDLSNSVFIEFR